jgi:hypothetical protein
LSIIDKVQFRGNLADGKIKKFIFLLYSQAIIMRQVLFFLGIFTFGLIACTKENDGRIKEQITAIALYAGNPNSI